MEPRATRTVHVVTACTDRKTRAPRSEGRARALPNGPLSMRFEAWREALTSSDETPIPASSLYSGDHWQVVRGLSGVPPHSTAVRVWVCSAGYGLIELGTPLRPYAATFDAAHPDAVVPRGSSFTVADWWKLLCGWALPDVPARSIADLAAVAEPIGDLVLIALSEQYLTATLPDVVAAAGMLGNRLLLLSAGTRADRLRAASGGGEHLAARLLPADASLKALVGGAMQSLNARLARRALLTADEWVGDPDRLHALFSQWGEGAPPLESYDRARSNDSAIQDYVRAALHEDASLTHTNLLRALRSSGRACEQSRFRSLFYQVREELALPPCTRHRGRMPA